MGIEKQIDGSIAEELTFYGRRLALTIDTKHPRLVVRTRCFKGNTKEGHQTRESGKTA